MACEEKFNCMRQRIHRPLKKSVNKQNKSVYKENKMCRKNAYPYLSTRAITWPNLTRQFPMSSSSVAVSLVMNEFYVHHGEGFSERSFGSQLMHSL